MDRKSTIRKFLQDLLEARGDNHELSDGTSLFLSGRLQSLDAVEVVMFLEEKFGVDFAVIGFDQAKIDSVDEINSLLESTELVK
ncbi:MAG: acyl carrier protein [Candidatus Acidiferrales bacterium]|jgi:acyl carrier protein